MAGQEREAFGLLVQQHGAQIAVADTDLALVRNRTGDAEGLQSGADPLGGFSSVLGAFLDSDSGAQFIGPLYVFEADGLGAFHDGVSVNALAVGKSFNFLEVFESVLVQNRLQLRHAAFIVFKQSHLSHTSPYSLRGSIHLTAPSSALNRP